jgi:hypothetical protein
VVARTELFPNETDCDKREPGYLHQFVILSFLLKIGCSGFEAKEEQSFGLTPTFRLLVEISRFSRQPLISHHALPCAASLMVNHD